MRSIQLKMNVLEGPSYRAAVDLTGCSLQHRDHVRTKDSKRECAQHHNDKYDNGNDNDDDYDKLITSTTTKPTINNPQERRFANDTR